MIGFAAAPQADDGGAGLPGHVGTLAVMGRGVARENIVVRSYASFEAEFPDDAAWSESGDLVRPGGRDIATTIAGKLTKEEEVHCTQPEQHKFYGWSFSASRPGFEVFCVLQDIEPWLLISAPRLGLWDRMTRRDYQEEHREFLTVLEAAIRSDSRFSTLRWFTPEEFDQ